MRSRSVAIGSRMRGRARGRRSFFCTDGPWTAGSGAARSTAFPMSSRWWRGTLRERDGRRIHRRRSTCPTGPTAWPPSSRRSGWGDPTWEGSRWGGGLALELYRRHPGVVRTLILASAYAGWAGSLPAEVVEQRLQVMLRNSELPPDRWAPALVRTFFSNDAPPEIVREALSIVSDLHPKSHQGGDAGVRRSRPPRRALVHQRSDHDSLWRGGRARTTGCIGGTSPGDQWIETRAQPGGRSRDRHPGGRALQH
jgi:pimeloyl-ACP methyl ester carboxylesterase